jgi:hypothetical protein
MRSAWSRIVTPRHARWTFVAVLAMTIGGFGCARLGFTDRVLLRAPSPDGLMVAVCQEVPAFDGPNYSVRLERTDGTLLRRLYEAGDGDRCDEIAWASNGRTLAVLTAPVARLRFVDVGWALSNPGETAYWSWREVSFAGEGQHILGKGLRFTDRMEIELQLCPYSLQAVQRTGVMECGAPPVRRRLSIPQPIVSRQMRASIL